jgi:hypothetical protein
MQKDQDAFAARRVESGRRKTFSDLQDMDKNSLILIYQMGKVGSSTLFATLQDILGEESLIQLHFLSESFKARASGHARYKWHLDQIVRVEQFRRAYPEKRIQIITLVREPVARDISSFFQNPHQFLGPGDSLDNIEVDELIRIYKEKNNYNYTLNWFDKEFKTYTGIDVYKKGFRPETGYTIFQEDEYDVLLLAMEHLSQCFQQALHEFLGIRVGCLITANESKNKKYSALSAAFKDRIRFPEEELRNIYNSKYVSAFYSAKEVQEFILKWSATSARSVSTDLSL